MKLSINILQRLQRADNIWIAVSGGMDSMVLLHHCLQLQRCGKLSSIRVIHVNHRLQPESNQWAEFVEHYAESQGIECITEALEGLEGTHIEEKARKHRYKAMFKHMGPNDLLLTAHHLEDQKETFMFRAFRGTSIYGLEGIRSEHTLYGHQVMRPLVDIAKSKITAYAKEHALSWVEDPSNQDTTYRRNEIRKALKQVDNTDDFLLTQMHLSRQSCVLKYFLAQALQEICPKQHILSLGELAKKPSSVQLELFHTWLANYTEVISYHRTKNLLQAFQTAREDRYPIEQIGGYSLLRYRDDITLLKLPKPIESIEGSSVCIDLGLCGKVHNPTEKNLSLQLLLGQKARYKKRLQSRGIPLWLRAYIPWCQKTQTLIFDDKDLCWEVPQEWQYWFSR